jgi:transcription termination factor Rho
MGVASPTKFSKEELIKKMNELKKDTKSTADVQTSKRGRPPKPSLLVQRPEGQLRTENRRINGAQNDVVPNLREPLSDILDQEENCEEREGILDVHTDGYGFIRVKNCEHSDKDVYVSAVKIRKLGLRRGDYVKGIAKLAYDNKPAALLIVNTVNGVPIEEMKARPNFDDLVPIYPDERIKLENARSKFDYAIRSIDLIAPIGKGGRAMIVSPPKAGKTTLLKKIANSISENYPEIILMVLLIDERPEEVTDMQRSIKGEVVYSTFDEMPEHHTKAAELLLSRAKRLVELGKDVVILMDSLTRLARAYNLTIPPTGRTLSGGIDPGALHSPKRFFGSARNIEFGGSLTIIATALVDTGSRMDDVIYEEFKGTGNMEIHLDRKLSEKRIFPAIDLNRSGTRREDLLLSQDELEGVWSIRKVLSSGDTAEATENLIQMLVKTGSNAEFIDQLKMQIRMMDKEGYVFRK